MSILYEKATRDARNQRRFARMRLIYGKEDRVANNREAGGLK